MVIFTTRYVFQTKLDYLIIDNEFVETYIRNKLFLRKDGFTKNIYHIIVIFSRLRSAGLKLNAPKWSFSLKYIPYLGYVITRDGIKTGPRRVQCIIYIVHTTTTTEVRLLVGMVHYYVHMCPRRSHITAYLILTTSILEGKKTPWKNCIEEVFKYLKHMAYDETLLNYSDCSVMFTVHNYVSNKQFSSIICQNNNTISFLYSRLSDTNYKNTEIE